MPADQAPENNPSSPPAPSNAAVAELLQKADKLIQARELEAAEDLLLEVLDTERSAPVLVMVGRVILEMEGPAAALPVFTEALQKDPANQDAHLYAANVFFQTGDVRCVAHTAQTVLLSPGTRHYKENFLACLSVFADKLVGQPQSTAIINAVTICLETSDIELQTLKNIWLTILSADPVYSNFYRCFVSDRPDAPPSLIGKMMAGKNGQVFAVFDAAHFARQKDLKPLCTPFFLNGLRQLQATHIGFEHFLTALRTRLLETAAGADAETHLALSSALAVYCWGTEYIFNTTAAEDTAIAKLRSKIEAAAKTADIANDIAVYACYAPLHHLQNADAIAATFASHPLLAQIIDADIGLYKKLQKQKEMLTAMSGFENDVSLRVREQYENFPYPRWKHHPMVSLEDIDAPLRKDGIRILIAGCGTGREAANTALKFPRASIEAIDLSTASLAYAMTKAEEFGIKNVRFRHGDILHLDFPDGYFDAIFCHGVLHHMEDPAAGWKSLLRCLKPDGLMRIGLYSEIARRDYIAAQRFIAEKGIASTTEAMKDFRRNAAKTLPYPIYTALVTQTKDYYQLSPLRDLLFHEQEHRMTLPGLGQMMDKLGIKLDQLAVDVRVRNAYRKTFGDAPDTFENWHKFEQTYPQTFNNMYQFWCSRNNAAPAD